LPADARRNFETIRQSGLELAVVQGKFSPATNNWLSNKIIMEECWLVDALFGTGLNRAMAAPFDEVVAMMNAGDNPILALDIPSGLDCDTGEPFEPTVRAAHTATFVAWKKGFLEPAAQSWLGEVHVVDIGAPKKLVDEFRRLRLGAGR
jgi:NAD(P)H-hydrate epimerase